MRKIDEHRVTASMALQKPLPPKTAVWRYGGNISNDNLVICQNGKYIRLLYRRLNAVRACGNPNWRICSFCQQYDDPANLYISRNENNAHHIVCVQVYRREYSRKNHNKLREYQRQYGHENHNKLREYQRQYRIKKRAAKGSLHHEN